MAAIYFDQVMGPASGRGTVPDLVLEADFAPSQASGSDDARPAVC